jgi:threonine/homoserine/homoserine lactone efflux protein
MNRDPAWLAVFSALPTVMASIAINGLVLGWSVSWPPGPVNAEMIRRSLLPKNQGGGFWPAWMVGIGACIGDFTWAFGVSLGAGAVLNTPIIRRVLAVISVALLLFLTFTFARSASRIFRSHRSQAEQPSTQKARRSALMLGFLMAVSSPWNLGFWLAVVGSQSIGSGSIRDSIGLAASVVLGALVWTLVLCTAVKLGARIFSRPEWQIVTQAITAFVMMWFAVRLLVHFP